MQRFSGLLTNEDEEEERSAEYFRNASRLGVVWSCRKATDDEEDDRASELLRNVTGPGVS